MNTERPEVLYHYTTMNTLCNMLNGVTDRGDGQTPDYRFRIWVSCADYMNDPLEGVFFRKCLHEASCVTSPRTIFRTNPDTCRSHSPH